MQNVESSKKQGGSICMFWCSISTFHTHTRTPYFLSLSFRFSELTFNKCYHVSFARFARRLIITFSSTRLSIQYLHALDRVRRRAPVIKGAMTRAEIGNNSFHFSHLANNQPSPPTFVCCLQTGPENLLPGCLLNAIQFNVSPNFEKSTKLSHFVQSRTIRKVCFHSSSQQQHCAIFCVCSVIGNSSEDGRWVGCLGTLCERR